MTEDDLAAIELVNSEIRAALKEQREPFEAGDLAKSLTQSLSERHPAELRLFALELVHRHVYTVIRNAMDSAAAQARREARDAPKRAFAEALQAAESGDHEPMRGLLGQSYCVDENRTRMMLADMRAPQLRFAADASDTLAAASARRAAFLRALEKKVGRKTVGEVFSEDRVRSIWSQLVGDSAVAA